MKDFMDSTGEYDPNADAEDRINEVLHRKVDKVAVSKTLSAFLLPRGMYRSTPRLTLNKYQNRQGPTTGRIVFSLSGEFVSLTPLVREAGETPAIVTGRLVVKVSPEEYKNDDGMPDSQSKLWAHAVRTYESATGGKDPDVQEVLSYLENYPFLVYTGVLGVATEQNPEPRGEPRNAVFSLTMAKE